MSAQNPPRVGVAVLITRADQVLLVHRGGPHGRDTWAPPGGHLDYGETPTECAAREVMEEIDAELTGIRFLGLTNDVFPYVHYITLWMGATLSGPEPRVAAPAELTELAWFSWSALPGPLFLPFQNYLNGNLIKTMA